MADPLSNFEGCFSPALSHSFLEDTSIPFFPEMMNSSCEANKLQLGQQFFFLAGTQVMPMELIEFRVPPIWPWGGISMNREYSSSYFLFSNCLLQHLPTPISYNCPAINLRPEWIASARPAATIHLLNSSVWESLREYHHSPNGMGFGQHVGLHAVPNYLQGNFLVEPQVAQYQPLEVNQTWIDLVEVNEQQQLLSTLESPQPNQHYSALFHSDGQAYPMETHSVAQDYDMGNDLSALLNHSVPPAGGDFSQEWDFQY